MRIQTKGGAPVRRALPRIGKIKVGEKAQSQSGKEYPTSLDYFRFDADEHYAEVARALYGERPAEIPLQFYADDGECLSHYYEMRDASGKLIAYGDGQEYRLITKDGWRVLSSEEARTAIPEAVKQFTTDRFKPVWREKLRIRFLLADFPALGYWEFSTMGKDSTIPSIIGVWDLVQQHRGSVVGLSFLLRVEKNIGNTAGQAKSYPVVTLIMKNGSNNLLASGQEDVVEPVRIGPGNQNTLLPAADGVADPDGGDGGA